MDSANLLLEVFTQDSCAECVPDYRTGGPMTQYETELRSTLAGDHVDIVETMSWFLAAIDAQA